MQTYAFMQGIDSVKSLRAECKGIVQQDKDAFMYDEYSEVDLFDFHSYR